MRPTGRASGRHLTAEDHARVVAAIEADPHASAKAIARETGLPIISVQRIRRRLLGAAACHPTEAHVQRALDALNMFPDNPRMARRAARMDEPLFEAALQRAALLGRLPAQGLPPAARPAPGFEISGVAVTTDAAGRVKARSVRTRREAGARFETPAGHRVKGVSSLVGPDGRELARWIKTRETQADPEALKSALIEALAGFTGCAGTVEPPALLPPDLLTVYVIADLHMGLLAWGRETGEAYDIAIARRMVLEAVGELIERAPPSGRGIILFLGDTTHQNSQSNMTPRSGHVLDVDGRFPKVLRAVAETALALGHRARARHGEVLMRFIPGNHDPEVAQALTLAMDLAFADEPRVTVDSDPGGHFFHRFGRVLLGATHGHTMPPDRMAMMLAHDRPEDWGQTKHRHFFFGHVHKESAREVMGVRVESFSSPAARDAYAHDGGWRSGRALSAITFHRLRGETSRHRVNIE